MKISLPVGSVLTGMRGAYNIGAYLNMSDRSISADAETPDGHHYRLKFYNGDHSISLPLIGRLKQIPSKGVLLPIDQGEYNGCPFLVFENLNMTDTGSYPISLDVLCNRIIPQLTYVINQYHRNRILLRDICPEHILYDPEKRQIIYCGFNNTAALPDKATITKQPGFGQEDCFVAPEVEKYGYSTCADYFALGVTLLTLIKGSNPMEGMSRTEFLERLSKGRIPGIDVQHLKDTPAEYYSEDDRIMYLVLGLMIPDPKNRWGSGEIRCWCNHQQIPLIRRGGRIPYQYNEPFVVGDVKCWNYRQLSQALSTTASAWTDRIAADLYAFAKRQQIAPVIELEKEIGLGSTLTETVIFRAIYSLNPGLDGFSWKGKKYADMRELIRHAARNKKLAGELSDILKDENISWFLKNRQKIANVSDADIREFEQIESWEQNEEYKGVNRCIMRFAADSGNRTFRIKGVDYKDIDSLILKYYNNGKTLKKISAEILAEQSFQAWLWSIGKEAAGRQALAICEEEPDSSFYLLLKIAEDSVKNAASKEAVRRLYMMYGEYAPVYWLTKNLHLYKLHSISGRLIWSNLETASLTKDKSLEELSEEFRRLLPDYYSFISHCADSIDDVKGQDLRYALFSFYPLRESGYFDSTWENDIRVCRDFLKYIGD